MDSIELEARWAARNYDPLPVVLTRGEGAYLWDDDGKRYIDMMSAYSAVSHGHAHPRILAALEGQARRLAVASRAYHSDRLGPFLAKLCQVTGLDARAADEHRRRGGRDRDQGARGAGAIASRASPRTAPRSSSPKAISTAAPRPSSGSRRKLLPRRVRAVHARLPRRAVRRPRRDASARSRPRRRRS